MLFGKLKKGGTVKVTVKIGEDGKEAGLNLEAIEDGPVTPKPEPLPKEKRPPRKRTPRPAFATARKPPSPPASNGKRGGLVPKVPLKTS